MRYDTPIFFVKESNKEYNPDTGKWDKGELIKKKRYANVTHMSAERQQTVFGDVNANRFIVRLQRSYVEGYDHIEIGEKSFAVDVERCSSDKQSLVVIQNG